MERRWRKRDVLLHGFKRKRDLKVKEKKLLKLQKDADTEAKVVKWK